LYEKIVYKRVRKFELDLFLTIQPSTNNYNSNHLFICQWKFRSSFGAAQKCSSVKRL